MIKTTYAAIFAAAALASASHVLASEAHTEAHSFCASALALPGIAADSIAAADTIPAAQQSVEEIFAKGVAALDSVVYLRVPTSSSTHSKQD